MPLPGTDEGVAPHHTVVGHATQVGGHPAARLRPLAGLLMGLEGADAHAAVAGHEHQLVVHGQRAARQRSRDHGARPLRREHPVHPEPGPPDVDGRRRAGEETVEGGPQVLHAAAGHGIDFDELRLLEEGAAQAFGDVEGGQLAQIVVDEANLCQSDDAVADAEQLHDAQVLL